MTTQQRKILIPNDWDDEDWTCVRVQWPNSEGWLSILRGFIVSPSRGRFWDETVGSVKDAQSVGFEIENINIPLSGCDGKELPKSSEEVKYIFVGGDPYEVESAEMSLCGYNPNAFRIDGGVLQVRDFCGEWRSIGEVGSTETPPIDDEVVWPPESAFSACGKAWAITDLIKGVANAIWDQRDNDPFSCWSNVSALYPGIMSRGFTINSQIAAISIEALQDLLDGWYGPELFDESTWQAITCSLSSSFDDTETLPDKDTLFALIMSKLDAQWPLDPAAQAFWYNVVKAIGENDIRNQGLAGAADTGRDCDCPQIAVPPYYGTLKFTSQFVATYPDEIKVSVGNNGKWADVEYKAPAGDWTSNDNVFIDMIGGENTDDVEFLVTPASGSNMPTEQYVSNALCPVTDPLQWVMVRPNASTGRTDTVNIATGGYKALSEWDNPVTLNICGHSPRKCGSENDTPAKTYRYRIEIVRHNGVSY